MRGGSLFSGIGGLDLGLERAGVEVVFQAEVDSFRRQLLRQHWPDILMYDDVEDIDEQTPGVDLLFGGFPCQPVSQAGLTRDDHTRHGEWLWPLFLRAVRVLRPRYVLVENVPGLLVRGMSDVLGDLAGLGFDAEWTCVAAASVGAPHIRDRVWIVGWLAEGPGRGSVLHSTEAGRGQAPGRVFPTATSGGWEAGLVERAGWWEAEPDVGRVAHGLPHQMDRVAALGDAVVPQVAEWIGRRILEFDSQRISDGG